jgi:hypothetical protein
MVTSKKLSRPPVLAKCSGVARRTPGTGLGMESASPFPLPPSQFLLPLSPFCFAPLPWIPISCCGHSPAGVLLQQQ